MIIYKLFRFSYKKFLIYANHSVLESDIDCFREYMFKEKFDEESLENMEQFYFIVAIYNTSTIVTCLQPQFASCFGTLNH